eukprot:TRINITY_DN43251_c0_g1_i1.p1 TRINITY_DN43251_c0_g1~~TRINITY_DN43251_c0_g1_i1.p1  ORF type:complete len:462 (-),score=66.24 TRINITY_DN43251_c0_g1_i1:104-1489(-)
MQPSQTARFGDHFHNDPRSDGHSDSAGSFSSSSVLTAPNPTQGCASFDSAAVTSTFNRTESWAGGGNTSHCTICYARFGIFRRPHHCRMCAACVCNSCSPNRIVLQDKPVRVCTPCVRSSVDQLDISSRGASFVSSTGTMPCIAPPQNSRAWQGAQRGGEQMGRKCSWPIAAEVVAHPVVGDDTNQGSISARLHDGQASSAWRSKCLADVPEVGLHETEQRLSARRLSTGRKEVEISKLQQKLAQKTFEVREVQAEVVSIRKFLVDFSDRICNISGKQISVRDLSEVSRNGKDSDSSHMIPATDVEQAFAQCEASLAPITEAMERIAVLQQAVIEKDKEAKEASSIARGLEDQLKRLQVGESSVLLSREDEDDPAAQLAWESDLENCSICELKFSKRALRVRHHCRMCGRCICSSCSPSTLQIKNVGLVRTCNVCVDTAFAGRLPLTNAFVAADPPPLHSR